MLAEKEGLLHLKIIILICYRLVIVVKILFI